MSAGGLTLTAGVGNLPAITAMYANLLQQERSVAEAGDRCVRTGRQAGGGARAAARSLHAFKRCRSSFRFAFTYSPFTHWHTAHRTHVACRYPYAERALTWAVLPPLLAAYGQPNTSSAAQDQQVTRGFADLGALTEPGLGLVWSDFRRWDGWRPLRWAGVQARRGAALLLRGAWVGMQAGPVPVWCSLVRHHRDIGSLSTCMKPWGRKRLRRRPAACTRCTAASCLWHCVLDASRRPPPSYLP